MCFRKKDKKVKVFKFTDEAVEFMRMYLLKDNKSITQIDMELIDEFVSIAFDWESLTVDEYGHEKTYDYPDKSRNEMADRFVSEVSGKLSTGWVPDFDDLNKRLGLS